MFDKVFYGNSGTNVSRVDSYVRFFRSFIIDIVWGLVPCGVAYLSYNTSWDARLLNNIPTVSTIGPVLIDAPLVDLKQVETPSIILYFTSYLVLFRTVMPPSLIYTSTTARVRILPVRDLILLHLILTC